ncbi:ribosomal subunit 39S-domain-containing protein [Cercophora scortea]|uniref:Large ribosomal subunit protein mL50 n=1 Tax=Cercophora scortea TaxID=314031 RepID=A0AAE0MH48_9PEZI|nr:ribosomal subunit 39S-domain-containing protein [Cercophora scortea]
MSRVTRLRSAASALSTSSSPAAAAAGPRAAPATCLLNGQASTTTTRPQLWQSRLQTTTQQQQQRCLSTSTPRRETALSNADSLEADFVEALPPRRRRPKVKTDLVIPKGIAFVTRVDAIEDPSYKPADSGSGLEEIGGLANWWDKPGHWGPSKEFVAFGPLDKITEPAMLEVLTKRAVIEALVLKRFAAQKTKSRLAMAATGDKEELLKVVGVELAAGEDGAATLKEEAGFQAVWDAMTENLPKVAKGEPLPVSKPAEPPISVTEAQQLAVSWGSEWKQASLRDPVVKFYTAKRIQRLTGHIISDFKMLGINTVGNLLSQLIKPPKAKKLVEELEARGQLGELPNVRVYPRRVTPVDKEKMVGRWKIITRELEKRDLPVIGTGGYKKSVEMRWASGNM